MEYCKDCGDVIKYEDECYGELCYSCHREKKDNYDEEYYELERKGGDDE